MENKGVSHAIFVKAIMEAQAKAKKQGEDALRMCEIGDALGIGHAAALLRMKKLEQLGVIRVERVPKTIKTFSGSERTVIAYQIHKI